MKKHFLSFILLALTLGFSANAWADVTIKVYSTKGAPWWQYKYRKTQGGSITEVNYDNRVYFLPISNCTNWYQYTFDVYSIEGYHMGFDSSAGKDRWSDVITTDKSIDTNGDAKTYDCGDEPTIPSVLKLDGNWNNRSWDNCQNLNRNVKVFTTTITVSSTNKFECCFKDDDNCKNAVIKPTTGVEYSGVNCAVGTSGDSNNNFTVTPSHAGDIDITVTYNDNNISVVFALVDPCPNCKTITK